MPKKSIREEILNRRKGITAASCLSMSFDLQDRFLSSPEFRNADLVALYSPIFNEVFTEKVAAASRLAAKRIAYPRVLGDTLEFVELKEGESLKPGAYGILEPPGESPLLLRDIDLVVIPGVAFDLSGRRLGYGKGYYDRAVVSRSKHTRLVGFSFELQVVEHLPEDPHDVRIDLLFTEERVIRY